MVKVIADIESARKKLQKKYPYLDIIEYNGYSSNAVFVDNEYGEFSGNYQIVFMGGKNHPERVVDRKKQLAFSKAEKLLSSKQPHLKLIEYNSVSSYSKVEDIEFGEFTGIFYNILIGHKTHKKRIEKRNFEKASDGISKKFKYLILKEFVSKNKTALFIDNEFGDFNGVYSSVFSGSCKHPNRLIQEKKEIIENKFSYLKLINFDIKTKTGLFLDLEYGEFSGDYYKVIAETKRHPQRSQDNKINGSRKQTTKDKRSNTCIEKYGCSTPLLNDVVIEKIKDTNIKRYGVPNVFMSKEIIDKTNATKIKNGIIHDFNGLSGMDLYRQESIDYSYTKFMYLVNAIGIEAAIKYNPQKTDIEYIIESILTSINETFVFNKKIEKTRYRPDFLLDNIIIEADGLNYHSDLYIKDINYHINKQKSYIENGYVSLFFRSDEIIKKTDIVKSIILAKLNKVPIKIFARKCLIDTNSKIPIFFEDNHIMGIGRGKTYSLVFNNDVVAAMRIIKKDGMLEISRFCNKKNTLVVGGFSKLLKAAIRDNNPSKVISFVDSRYGSGDSLKNLGFVEESNYVSFKWTDFTNTYHRMKFKGNSGYKNGLYKIWDCGQKKFVLTLKE
jgi:very-short-patch-repair endonuclease